MVKIEKSGQAMPRILAAGGKGFSLSQQLRDDFFWGKTTFRFNSKIYGHTSVKSILKSIQNNKCCFCEARVSHVSHGDVEHFRPKMGYQAEQNSPFVKPGYFWLAYDFFNLFFTCQICNQIFKKNFFPLADESTRAKSPDDDIFLEENLILNPEFDQPEQHIVFHREIASPRNGSKKGEMTILFTGLNRPKLADDRLDYLLLYDTIADLARDLSNPKSAAAQFHFKKIGQPSHIYSRMIQDNFPDLV